MSRAYRPIAFVALLALGGEVLAAPAGSPVRRLGKTVVRHHDSAVTAVLSWKYANQTFGKEPWLLLELAFAAEGRPLELDREDVSLRTPDGESIPLPGQKRLAESFKDVRWFVQKSSVARDPLTGYFPSVTLEQRLPFFTVPGGAIVQDRIGGGPTMLTRGDLFFEAPSGVWKPGRYALVLKNKGMDVELPFHLPADDVKAEKKGREPGAVTW